VKIVLASKKVGEKGMMLVMGFSIQRPLHPALLLLRRIILAEGTPRHRVEGQVDGSAIGGRLEGLDRAGIRRLADHKGHTMSSGVSHAEDLDG